MGTIRVLHVLGGVGLGGAESRIMDLYRQMDRNQIQFDFLVHSEAVSHVHSEAVSHVHSEAVSHSSTQYDTSVRKPQFYDDEIQNLGGHIYVLPKFRVYNYFAYRRAITAFFREHHEFRVVQGHMTSTAGIYLPIAKKSGVPITVAHSRNAGVEKGLKGLATRFFRYGLAKKADFLFACSELAARDVFGARAFEQNRVKIIHNAIDVRRFTYDQNMQQQTRKELGLTDKLVLGHVGRFNYQKNHPYLIDIFAAVCKKRDDAALLLLGEGNDMDVIKEKCRRLDIYDKVIFAGNQRETEKYYQAMDVFLLPSFFEGLPGVLMEAQAAGLRCFVSDTVTREAKATDLVDYLSIEQPPENWADEILKNARYERHDTYEALAAAGFDVRGQAAAYSAFYQKGDASKL